MADETARRTLAPGILAALAACFFLSGIAGLAYEVVWTRMLILVFGATTFAISTVLTAFMAGLALGGWLGGRMSRRLAEPALAYGILEVGIGLYALAVPFLFEGLEPVFRYAWQAFHLSFPAITFVRFLLAGSVLVFPTVLMGATLPVLSSLVASRREGRGFRVGLLYALNTFGAVGGALLAGFVLLPSLGVTATVWTAAAVNLAVGLGVIGLSLHSRRRGLIRRSPPAPAKERSTAAAAPPPPPPAPAGVRLVLWLIFISGFVVMMYEVAWSRVLGLMIGSSVYAFTVILATYLIGLAGGAAVVSPFLRRLPERAGLVVFGALQAAAAVTVFVTLLAFDRLPYLYASFARSHVVPETGVFHYRQLTILQFLMAGFVMLGPAAILGAAFPAAVHLRSGRGEETGSMVGRVYSVNTIGAILGSFAGGFLLVPFVGIQNTLLLGIAANGLMGAFALLHAGRHAAGGPSVPLLLSAAGAGVFAVFGVFAAPSWNALLMSRGVYKYALDPNLKSMDSKTFEKRFLSSRDLLFYKEGITTTVCVVDQGGGHVYLATNGKVDASSRMDMPTQVLLAQIPMAVAPRTREVLVIGFASGTTVGSALLHPLERLTAAEIEPAVIEASKYFEEWNNRPLADPRLDLIHEDGRNYLGVTDRRFDLIISEPSNPWMTIASNLFTVDYYEIAAERLKPGGCYCQWLQLYALRPQDVQCLVRTFRTVFPCCYAFYSKESVDLMLVGSREDFRIDVAKARRRVNAPAVLADLNRVRVDSLETLLAHFIAGPGALKAFAEGAPLNTDDNARIEFATPKTIALNEGDRIQAEILAHTEGIGAYLQNFGETPAERADFVLQIAIASEPYGEGVRALTAAFARNALALDPGNERIAFVARELMGGADEAE